MTPPTNEPKHSSAAHRAARISARGLTTLLWLLAFGAGRGSAQVAAPNARASVQLEADQQRKEGSRYIADGNVQVRYENKLLRADRAEYDSDTGALELSGHVQFDSDMQHIQAERGHYDVRKSSGTFTEVHGTVQTPRQPNPAVLLSSNPLYFEAREVERLDDRTYRLHSAWMTICLPENPLWKFFAPEATLHVDDHVALIHSNFRILRVPLLYTPYARVPVGPRVRQSGFTIPDVSHASNKGWIIGDSFYWAPVDWMDAEVGAELYTDRGWSQTLDVRARPSASSRLVYSYFGVQDRGPLEPGGRGPSQSGHQSHFFGEVRMAHGWRAVADVNQLSSLTFRLAFATTYTGATSSELVSTGFLNNNFRGYSFNFAASQYRDFLSSEPGDIVELRRTPQVRFSSVEQQPWERWPVYFSFDTYTGANYRSDPQLKTPPAVERSEVAPRVTVPLHFGPWLGLTTTATGRATHYGAQLAQGAVSSENFVRTTGEFTAQIQTPAIERVWGARAARERAGSIASSRTSPTPTSRA